MTVSSDMVKVKVLNYYLLTGGITLIGEGHHNTLMDQCIFVNTLSS